MKSIKNDKTKLAMMAIITMLVLITAGVYAFMVAKKHDFALSELLPITIILLVVIIMIFFIFRRLRDLKHNVPLEDERSKKVLNQAAAKAFYISLYWLLAISWFEPFFAQKIFGLERLDAGQTVGGGIAGMTIIFFACWFYYSKKGELT